MQQTLEMAENSGKDSRRALRTNTAAKSKLSLKTRKGRTGANAGGACKNFLPSISAPKLKNEVVSKLKGRNSSEMCKVTSKRELLSAAPKGVGEGPRCSHLKECSIEIPSAAPTASKGSCSNDLEDCSIAQTAAAYRSTGEGPSFTCDLKEPFIAASGVEVGFPGGGVSSDSEGLGCLFFCHLCQKDLTNFSVARRQQHMNKCCDDAGADVGVSRDKLQFPCILCQKKFHHDQVQVHMKTCAKKRGVSTAELLDMIHARKEGGLPQMQADLKSFRVSDSDFKRPPARRSRKRARAAATEEANSLHDMEYEQLQVALAMSASLGTEEPTGGMQEMVSATNRTRTSKRRKGSKLEEKKPEPLPLLTVSRQQARAIIASRAEQLLRPVAAIADRGETEEDYISCTPAFGSSSLAKEVCYSQGCVVDTKERLSGGENDSEGGNDSDGELASEEGDELASEREDMEATKLDRGAGWEDIEANAAATKLDRGAGWEDMEAKLDRGAGSVLDGSPMALCLGPVQGVTGGPPLGHDGLGAPGVCPEHAAARSLVTSFAEELQDVAYPTLWQLGACKLTTSGLRDYYVPALSSVMEPSKNNPLLCKQCNSEVCSMTFDPQAPQATVPMEEHHSDHVSVLLAELASMINSPLLSDLSILTARGARISAHGCILAARCPGFRDAVLHRNEPPKMLDLSEFASEVVLSYLKHVYCAASLSGKMLAEQGRRELESLSVKMASREMISDRIKYATDEVVPLPLPVTPATIASQSTGNEDEDVTLLATSPPARDFELDSDASVDTLITSPLVISSPPARDFELDGDASETLITSPLVVSSAMYFKSDVTFQSESALASNPSLFTKESSSSPICIESSSSPEVVADEGEFISLPDICPILIDQDSICGDQGSSPEILEGFCSSPEIFVEFSSSPESCPSPGILIDHGELVDQGELSSSPEFVVPGSSGDATPTRLDLTEAGEGQSKLRCREERTETERDQLPMKAREKDSTLVGDVDWSQSPLPPVDHTPSIRDSTLVGEMDWSPPPVDHTLAPRVDHAPSLRPPRGATPIGGNLVPSSVGACSAFATPTGGAVVLLSDNDLTPTPNYRAMHTPHLKNQCARFGVKVLPKRKMIAKLREIYAYTHPLVDEDGAIVPEAELTAATAKPQSAESMQQQVRDIIRADKELYLSVLLYQPIDIGLIQGKLKIGGLSIGKDKLADVLDFMCVTFTETRATNHKKTF